jgi:2-polyprenyl-6-hydroxyphenyl methylase/3-demethylubiquinone-9 3-methyltransferase
MPERPNQSEATLDPAEIDRFARLASEWWDADGKFHTLHQIGPARLTFLRDQLLHHFGRRQGRDLRPLDGLSILDVGCGGGLVSEPLARLGATVTGIDPARENIEAARRHAAGEGLRIDYRAVRIEDLLAVVGAEYVLRWLPVGTHQWERFVTPDELRRHLKAAGLEAPVLQGLVYSPLSDAWTLSADTDVNYFAAAAKPG